jgi:hypothetical protein
MSLDGGKDLMRKLRVVYRHIDFAASTCACPIQIARSHKYQFLVHNHKLDVTLVTIHHKRLSFVTLELLNIEARLWSSESPPL